jgi:hypothetical protein
MLWFPLSALSGSARGGWGPQGPASSRPARSGCTNVEPRSASTRLGGEYLQEGGLLRKELSLQGIPWVWSRNLNWDGVRLARCPSAGPRGSGCRAMLYAATPGSLACGPPSARQRRWQNGLNRPVLKHGPRSLTYVRVLRLKTFGRGVKASGGTPHGSTFDRSGLL